MKTPYVLTVTNPTDQQVAQLLNRSWFDIPLGSDGAPFNQFVRQDIDVDGDGQAEIVITGKIGEITNVTLYVAVLDQINGFWEQVYADKKYGHYCGETRAVLETDHITVDFLTCGGGTGLLSAWWDQEWVKCEANACKTIWLARLFETGRSVNYSHDRGYTIGQIERPDVKTVRLIKDYFAITNLLPLEPYGPTPPYKGDIYSLTRRTVGPNTVDTYRWDGAVFQHESHEQLAPGQVVMNEFDEQTDETTKLVSAILAAPFRKDNGEFDSDGYAKVTTEFWGPPAGVLWNRYGESYADVAAHNGQHDGLGEWIAAVTRISNDRPMCRLTVQHYISGKFDLTGRVELPCISNFTHLAWVDVTGDGKDDLILITVPPDDESGETGAGLQRLYLYEVGDGVKLLAKLDGAVNGADGAGIRWQKTKDGKVEVLVGFPFMPLDNKLTTWPILQRRFQVYRWDEKAQSLVPQEIEVEP